jgi:NAD-dependent SIR2 family protein deacetylase
MEPKEAVARAQSFVFAAGAGMGVDSGLPDFRGNEGFWKAYPPFAKLGLGFMDLANPRWFADDPELAWGFYGHRLALYRSTVPHPGFGVLLGLGRDRPSFVFTSNVDGQFQRAGFSDDEILECHGSLHHLQCRSTCGWFSDASIYEPSVDPETLRARGPLPRCPRCGDLARPALLMFGDPDWDDRRSVAQEARYERFLTEATGGPMGARGLLVIECGAGTAVPTVRHMSETLVRAGASLLRINVRESQVPRGQMGLAMGAREGLESLL